MINNSLEHVPINMEAKDTNTTTSKNEINVKGNNDNLLETLTTTEITNKEDIDLMDFEEDDFEEEVEEEDYDDDDDYEDSETDILDDVEAASLLISSDEEAELEAQRIRFPVYKKKKAKLLEVGQGTMSTRNLPTNASSSSSSRITTEANVVKATTPSNIASALSTEGKVKNLKDITHTTVTNAEEPKKDTRVTAATIATITTPTTTTLNINTIVERGQCSTVGISGGSPLPGPTTIRQTCGSILAHCAETRFVFHCEFCDIHYGGLDKFTRHLQDTHKLLGPDKEHEKENSPRNNTHKLINTISRCDLNVKKEPLTPELLPVEPLPSISEPIEFCAHIFTINQRKLSLQCGQCEDKYDDMDLLEKHLRQQHQVFQKRNNSNQLVDNVRPEVVVKKEVYNITQVVERSPPILEVIPPPTEEVPPVTEKIPQVTEMVPHVTDDMKAQVTEIISQVPETVLKDAGVTSKINEILVATSKEDVNVSLEKEMPIPSTRPTAAVGGVLPNEVAVRPAWTEEIVPPKSPPKVLRRRGRPPKNQTKDIQKPTIIPAEPKNLRQTLKRKLQQDIQTKNDNTENSKQSKTVRRSRKSVTSHIPFNKDAKGSHEIDQELINRESVDNSKDEELKERNDDDITAVNEACSSEHLSIPASVPPMNSPAEADLDNHLTIPLKRHACEQCDRSFAKYSRLLEHQRLHTGEKPFNCDQCGKHFRIKMRLNEHQLRHNKEKKYKCEMCGLAMATRQDLTLHMRHHAGDRRYQCSACPKAFVRSSDLKIHVRIHTGEKPYVCDICNKSFRANQNLIVHKRSHMGDDSKAYKCEQCDKRFMRNMDRKVHMRTHTGEKPYKCEICQRGYSSRVHVRAHIQREHVAPNGIGLPPKGKRKPGPKPKALKEELAKQKKLIEELKQQLMQKMKTDEKVEVDELATCESGIGKQEPDSPCDEMPKMNSPKPSLCESPTVNGQEQQGKKPTAAVISPLTITTRRIEPPSPTTPNATNQIINTTDGNGDGTTTTTTTMAKVVTPKSASLGIQQVSVTVSMQVGNVDDNRREKENSGCLRSNLKLTTTPPSGVSDAKKERKITSYFTVIGQKNEI